MPLGRRAFSIRMAIANAQNDGASRAVFELGRACQVPDGSAVLTAKILGNIVPTQYWRSLESTAAPRSSRAHATIPRMHGSVAANDKARFFDVASVLFVHFCDDDFSTRTSPQMRLNLAGRWPPAIAGTVDCASTVRIGTSDNLD